MPIKSINKRQCLSDYKMTMKNNVTGICNQIPSHIFSHELRNELNDVFCVLYFTRISFLEIKYVCVFYYRTHDVWSNYDYFCDLYCVNTRIFEVQQQWNRHNKYDQIVSHSFRLRTKSHHVNTNSMQSTTETDIQLLPAARNDLLRLPKFLPTRNTFCGTWYLPHSYVHNEQTVPMMMAGCMAHARNGYIFTSGLKSDVTIVFLGPDFF